MPKVKVLNPNKRLTGANRHDVIEVSEDRAERWVEQGLVEYVKAPKPEPEGKKPEPAK